MRIKLHIMMEDMGDGSTVARVGPSQAALREKYSIGEDDFHTEYGDVPVEWDVATIEVSEYEVVS